MLSQVRVHFLLYSLTKTVQDIFLHHKMHPQKKNAQFNGFSVYLQLPNYHHNQFHYPQRKSCTHQQLFPRPPPPQHLATTNISVSIAVPILAIAYKWNHTIKLFVTGFFKPVYDFKIIHTTCISTALLFLSNNISLFTHLPLVDILIVLFNFIKLMTCIT